MPSSEDAEAGRDPTPERGASSRFRRTLVRVMAMQVVALLALWLLQTIYAP